jgi:hypothetical protein
VVDAVGSVELASDAVVAEVTVAAQGAWALVLMEEDEPDPELELDGTLNVGAGGGGGIVELVAAAADDPLKGDGAAVVGAAAPVGAVCAPAFIAVKRIMPATAPRRTHRSGKANVDRRGIIAGDP